MKYIRYVKNYCFIIIVMACSVSPASAQEVYQLAAKMKKGDMAQIYQQLNLTEQQKRALEQNRLKHHEKLRATSTRIRLLKRQINLELEKSSINQQKLNKLKNELDLFQSRLNETRLEGIMNVREILSPQQYNLFQQLTH